MMTGASHSSLESSLERGAILSEIRENRYSLHKKGRISQNNFNQKLYLEIAG